MGNCLITKLKGSVSNENLDELGKVTIFLQYHSDNDREKDIIRFRKKQGTSIHFVSDSPTYDGYVIGVSEGTISDDGLVYFELLFTTKEGGVHVTFDSVYDFTAVQSSYGTISKGKNSLLGFANWIDFGADNTKDISAIKNNPAIVGVCFSRNNSGAVDAILGLSDKTHLKVTGFTETTNALGVEMLAFTRLQQTNFSFQSLEYVPTSIREFGANKVKGGSLEDFVQRLRNAGRTSGAIKMSYMCDNKCGITYDGDFLFRKFNASGMTCGINNFVTWTEDSISITDQVPANYVAPETLNTFIVE